MHVHCIGGTRLWHRICDEDKSDMSFVNRMIENGTEHDEKSVSARHASCGLPKTWYGGDAAPVVEGKRIDLRLLRTCRLIHREAALLPFATNTFSFLHCTDLSVLYNLLMPAQRRAITSLVVYPEANGAPHSGCHSALNGLKYLTIITDDILPHWQKPNTPILVHPTYYRFKDLKFSRALSLASVNVLLTAKIPKNDINSPRSKKRFEIAREMARSIERDFLNPWDEDGRGAEEDPNSKKREQARCDNRARCGLRTTKGVSYV